MNGKFEKTTKGSPRGPPLSPMLSNIVLNELDHELERRGLQSCRWADDFVILLKSERAGHRVMAGITHYIENELGLKVNTQKSKIAKIKELNKYLRGWTAYFRIQEFKQLFRDLDGWIRSRLRSTQLKKWKKPMKFQRVMIAQGVNPREAHRVWTKMDRWKSVNRSEVRFIMDLNWFRNLGLFCLHDYTLALSQS